MLSEKENRDILYRLPPIHWATDEQIAADIDMLADLHAAEDCEEVLDEAAEQGAAGREHPHPDIEGMPDFDQHEDNTESSRHA